MLFLFNTKQRKEMKIMHWFSESIYINLDKYTNDARLWKYADESFPIDKTESVLDHSNGGRKLWIKRIDGGW